ncbi:hypothetical protein [Variovorax sp. LjRoot130]|uniref:hypothetical protein n=1 Tax=Variovorax sp. LjRoot130 TaxID=3342261 RepID=UPI003F5118A4
MIDKTNEMAKNEAARKEARKWRSDSAEFDRRDARCATRPVNPNRPVRAIAFA